MNANGVIWPWSTSNTLHPYEAAPKTASQSVGLFLMGSPFYLNLQYPMLYRVFQLAGQPPSCVGNLVTSNTWFLKSTLVTHPNSISISWAIIARLTNVTNRHTYHTTPSVVICHHILCTKCMWCDMVLKLGGKPAVGWIDAIKMTVVVCRNLVVWLEYSWFIGSREYTDCTTCYAVLCILLQWSTWC